MAARRHYAATHALPDALFESLSALYTDSASRLLGTPFSFPERPREALLDLLNERYRLLR